MQLSGLQPAPFVQDDWKIAEKFIAEACVRFEYHNTYGSFALPRLSLLYKISTAFTTRLGVGLRYKIPSQFVSDIDERDYAHVIPNNGLTAEKSTGVN